MSLSTVTVGFGVVLPCRGSVVWRASWWCTAEDRSSQAVRVYVTGKGAKAPRKFVLLPDDGHSRANAGLPCCSFAAYCFHPCRSRTWGFSWWFSACARPSLPAKPRLRFDLLFAHHLRPRHLTHSSSFLNTMATMILPVCLAPPQSFPRLASCPACLATNPVILAFLPPETASSQSSKPKDPLSVYLSYLLLGKHLKWPPLGMGGGREGGSKRGRNNRLGEQKSSVDCAQPKTLARRGGSLPASFCRCFLSSGSMEILFSAWKLEELSRRALSRGGV